MTDLTHGQRTRATILTTGLVLWRDDPATVSARKIGQRLGMTHGAILHYFANAAAMRDAIAAEAIRTGDAVVVPMLIATRHPAAATLSSGDRRRYMAAGC